MKYKALIEIGGYNPGEIVPTEKAEVWEKMYKESPVQKVGDDEKEIFPVEEKSTTEETVSEEAQDEEVLKDVTLDDYLERNTRTVVSSVEGDALSKYQLQKLLDLEKSNKKRKKVIHAIKIKLGE